MNRINKFFKYNLTRLVSSAPGFDTNLLYKNQYNYTGNVMINNFFNRNENNLIKIHLKNIEKNYTTNSEGLVSNNSYLKYLIKNNLQQTISYITDTNIDLSKDSIYYTLDKCFLDKNLNDIDKKYINCIIKIDKSNNKENQIFIYHSRIDKEYYIEMSNKCKNTMLIHLLLQIKIIKK